MSLKPESPIGGRWPLALLLVLAFASALLRVADSVREVGFRELPAQAAPQAAAHFERGFMPNPDLIEIHSASLMELGDGRARAFWISGNEGSADAVIGTSVFDRRSGSWGPVTTAATAAETSASVLRFVKKVGNAVARRDESGRIWLFYVSVSVGGWAGSALNVRTSTDDGATWSRSRRLVTSPFLNLSTLVRNAPIVYQDGSIGVPAYHEFITKCAELLRIDPAGYLVDKQRLNTRYTAVQPLVLVESPQRALVMMRNASESRPRRVIQTETDDAGRRWAEPTESSLRNPGSPLSGVALPDGRLVVVANNSESSRRRLSLYASSDRGNSWRIMQTLDDQSARKPLDIHRDAFTATMREVAGQAGVAPSMVERVARFATDAKCYGDHCDFEYSYPSLTRTDDGEYLLVYTWNRTLIAWAKFNQAWVDQQLSRDGQTE